MRTIHAGDRVVVIGPPSSGKSNFQAWMLTGLSSVVVVDSKKHPREWSWWGPRHGYHVTSDPDDIARYALVIYQPSHAELQDYSDGSPWTRALHRIQERGRTHVVFDETVQTLPAGRPHPMAMVLYTQGAAYGITCWAGTQIANRIETLTLRMAEHCISFWVGPTEAAHIAVSRGIASTKLTQLRPYHSAYHRMGPGNVEWEETGPVELVFPKRSENFRADNRRDVEVAAEGSGTAQGTP